MCVVIIYSSLERSASNVFMSAVCNFFFLDKTSLLSGGGLVMKE